MTPLSPEMRRAEDHDFDHATEATDDVTVSDKNLYGIKSSEIRANSPLSRILDQIGDGQAETD